MALNDRGWHKAVARAARAGLLTLLAELALCVPAFAQTSDLVSKSEFRVCADPANDPQSNKDGQGYENRLAELFANKLDRKLTYYWFPMSTGFIRNTLAANKCDVVMGYSAGHELVLNTNPYMTSTYVLVTKKDSDLASVDHLGDEKLKQARLGVVAGSPPASHLARLGLLKNIKPFPLFIDRRHMNPSKKMLDDVKSGEIGAAIMWGPIAGPMIKQAYPGLNSVPLIKEQGKPLLYTRITMGVRRGETAWKRKLNSTIRRNQGEIDKILVGAGVPLLDVNGKKIKQVE